MASKWGNNIWNLVLCKTGELDFLIDAFLIIAQKEYKILESNVSLRKKNLHCANRIFMVTRVNSHCANRIFKLFIRRYSLRKKNGQIWWSLRLLRIFVSLRKKNLSGKSIWKWLKSELSQPLQCSKQSRSNKQGKVPQEAFKDFWIWWRFSFHFPPCASCGHAKIDADKRGNQT